MIQTLQHSGKEKSIETIKDEWFPGAWGKAGGMNRWTTGGF